MEFVNEQAEQLLLAALLNDPEILYDVERFVSGEDFYLKRHELIFQGIRHLFNKNAYDIKTLVQILRTRNRLEEVGGLEYISFLKAQHVTRNAAIIHAKKVKEQSMYRSAMRIADQIQEAVREAAASGETETFAHNVMQLFNTFDTVQENKMRHISEVVESALKKNQGSRKSPKLGFKHIDAWMRGIGNERLIVIAGRPGTGKTAFALTACRNIAAQNVGAVPVFSIEMSSEELANRILSDLSGVPFSTIMTADYQGLQGEAVERARQKLSQLPLYIDDSPRIDYEYIVSQCRRLKREHGELGAVMIDYLGLVKIHEKKNRTKADLIGELTSDLKRLTRELGCSIILLVQMNREIDKRQNKRPVLSDLRDSGSIEQDADMVIFLHKDEERSTEEESHIDFIVEKGRQTGVAEFELSFIGAIQRFEVKE